MEHMRVTPSTVLILDYAFHPLFRKTLRQVEESKRGGPVESGLTISEWKSARKSWAAIVTQIRKKQDGRREGRRGLK